jgi:uncharacterized protein
MLSLVIDGFEFCRLKENRTGRFAVSDLPRLAEETADRSGDIEWNAEGSVLASGHPRIKLSVSGTIGLICQRCLTPYGFRLDSGSTIVLARSEEGVDELESFLDDDSIDVIAGDTPINLAELIEDEILLTLPVSPKHEQCPSTQALDKLKNAAKPSPFAVLKDLKREK